MKLSAGGVAVQVPPGWDVRIGRTRAQVPGARSNTLVHAANFILPDGRGDFGSGAVDVMGPTHVLVVLFEFGPDSAGTPLFAQSGLPRQLSSDWFNTNQLQRTVAGQAGLQRFFVERGRPFSLYVVLGSYRNRVPLVQAVNGLLSGLTL